MSAPLTAQEQVDAFKLWNVKFREDAGWRDRHRDNSLGNARNGIMIHHTAMSNPPNDQTKLLREGRPDLAGPLCNYGQTRAGVAVLIGNGRANHAGLGSSRVLSHVIAEDYPGFLHELSPGPDDVDGNAHFYGQETYYDGSVPMTQAQMLNTIRLCAALCDAHGWTAKSVIGHREWTARKPDPGHVNMAELRSHVRELLAVGPNHRIMYRR